MLNCHRQRGPGGHTAVGVRGAEHNGCCLCKDLEIGKQRLVMSSLKSIHMRRQLQSSADWAVCISACMQQHVEPSHYGHDIYRFLSDSLAEQEELPCKYCSGLHGGKS